MHHLVRDGSDHAPLNVYCQEDLIPIKPFRFLSFWTKHQSFKEVARKSWEEEVTGSPFHVMNEKLKRLKVMLSTLSEESNRDFFKKTVTLEDIIRMKEIQLEIDPLEENRADLRRTEA